LSIKCDLPGGIPPKDAPDKILSPEQAAKADCVYMATITNTIKLYSEKDISGSFALKRNGNSDNTKKKSKLFCCTLLHLSAYLQESLDFFKIEILHSK